MGDAFNIQNLLSRGFFTTSRARSADPAASSRPSSPSSRAGPPEPVPPPVPAHGQVPRTVYLAPAPISKKKNFPPPVTVEEEAESLANEHAASRPAVVSEEEPPSRGEVDQTPIIMQVHHHNPERRFVIVPKDAKDQPPAVEQTANVERRPENDISRDQCPSRREPKSSHATHERDDAGVGRSGSERPKGRRDLPPLDTDLNGRADPQRYRTRSAGPRPRPDGFDTRQPRPCGDQPVSPKLFSAGATVREKAYYAMSQASGAYSARSPSRTRHRCEGRDRGYERDGHPHDRTYSTRQSAADLEKGRPRRRMTNDVDTRSRDECRQARSDKRGRPQAYARPEGPRPRLSPRTSRDSGTLKNDYPRSSREAGSPSSKPVVIQDAKSSVRRDTRDESLPSGRSTSRTNTFPPTAAAATSAMADEAARATSRDGAKSASRSREQPPARPSKPPLPYPDDHLPPDVLLGMRHTPSETRQPSAGKTSRVYMPEPPPTHPSSRSLTPTHGTATASTAVNTSQPWTTAPFDPEKDGLPSERPMGTYRRFSENNSRDGADILPECPRQEPVAGFMDWLTLPHTAFNMCPSCYNAVFEKSEYRTRFKPMLRPSNEPIACDFGVSPWYRIAWLLTLKDHVPDLRLLQQIARAGAASNREQQACPGNQKVTRNWLTVKDPHTRLPVDRFSVCHQCARLVEVLLPNLTGVFEPADSRPRTDVCALHFAPERKRFVLIFDALETTSDRAMVAKKPPDVDELARQLWHLAVGTKCRRDTPVMDGYWHTMQFLREFTVCANCFEEVVRPKIGEGNAVARNFYAKPQRVPSATCQLYSGRMREIFRRSCRNNDPQYLEEKVLQRRRREKDIYDELVEVDRANASSLWKEEEVGKLVEEWRRWE